MKILHRFDIEVSAVISLSKVSKLFRSGSAGIKAVDNVNLTINKSEIFGIIGYSGAGKSTLIRMLNGLETPTEGSVIVVGKEISTQKIIHKHITQVLITFVGESGVKW